MVNSPHWFLAPFPNVLAQLVLKYLSTESIQYLGLHQWYNSLVNTKATTWTEMREHLIHPKVKRWSVHVYNLYSCQHNMCIVFLCFFNYVPGTPNSSGAPCSWFKNEYLVINLIRESSTGRMWFLTLRWCNQRHSFTREDILLVHLKYHSLMGRLLWLLLIYSHSCSFDESLTLMALAPNPWTFYA